MYTILTTCPDSGSRNVGDKLIEVRLKDIMRREKGDSKFITIFREDSLNNRLDEINASRAVLMPAFPVRDTPMYPRTYRLTDCLADIKVPMIPVGANWNVYPGDEQSRRETNYSQATVNFIRYIAKQVDQVSCREPFTCDILKKHGVENTLLTGDPAMFSPRLLGVAMKRPSEVRSLVFSPPLSFYYKEQADCIMTMLADLFPSARKICVFHLFDADTSPDKQRENSAAVTPEVTAKNRYIRSLADRLGYEVINLAGNVEGMSVYDECDLHVGYECHAHLYFLSMRIPSVLIAEDARGVGFNQLFGVGGFSGFARREARSGVIRKTYTSGYCTTREEADLAPPRDDLHQELQDYLKRELKDKFKEYKSVGPLLDTLYERAMAPFIRAIP